MIKLISQSAEETHFLGEKLGSLLQGGNILCLSGDMGAGKTAFTKGIGKGMGIEEYITSPTYTIVNEHEGRIPLYHFDVYRLESVEEMYEIGYEEYFFSKAAVVIEWADIIEEIIPDERLWITLKKSSEDNVREIILDPIGKQYCTIAKELEKYANTGA